MKNNEDHIRYNGISFAVIIFIKWDFKFILYVKHDKLCKTYIFCVNIVVLKLKKNTSNKPALLRYHKILQ